MSLPFSFDSLLGEFRGLFICLDGDRGLFQGVLSLFQVNLSRNSYAYELLLALEISLRKRKVGA